MSTDSDSPSSSPPQKSTQSTLKTNNSQIKISIIAPTSDVPLYQKSISATSKKPLQSSSTTSDSPKITSYLLSPNLLLSPTLDMFQFPSKLASNLSSSFNCLSASIKQSEDNLCMLRNPISTSDSNLKSGVNTNAAASKNIFNFGDFFLNPMELHRHPVRGRPPLSPYRAKSPLLSHTSFETPPSSPLTPIAVLQTLPAFMLTPIFQWLYAECLPADLEEETLEKLINFSESTVPLNKMMDPCRRYLKNTRLKKCKFNIS